MDIVTWALLTVFASVVVSLLVSMYVRETYDHHYKDHTLSDSWGKEMSDLLEEGMLAGHDTTPDDCTECGGRLAVVRPDELKCIECNKRYDR